MMSLCVYPDNIRSCTGFILQETVVFGKNFWSLLCSTGVLFYPPGGSVFVQSTTGWQRFTTGLIWFVTGCCTDTNTYSHAHLLRNQFNNLHNTSTKPDQAVVIIGTTRQTSSNVLMAESSTTTSNASSNETRWVFLLHWASSTYHGQTTKCHTNPHKLTQSCYTDRVRQTQITTSNHSITGWFYVVISLTTHSLTFKHTYYVQRFFPISVFRCF